jgi:hypothetical protein
MIVIFSLFCDGIPEVELLPRISELAILQNPEPDLPPPTIRPIFLRYDQKLSNHLAVTIFKKILPLFAS